MTSYTDVKQYVRNVTHRPQTTGDGALTSAQFNLWDDVVTQRINNELRTSEQIITSSYTTAASENPFDFSPGSTTNGEVLEVAGTSNGKRYKLQNASRETMNLYIDQTGPALFYNMEGEKMRIAPYADGVTLTIVYRTDYLNLQTSSTNNLLTAWPQVYYNAFLALAYEYLRDFEASQYYWDVWRRDVQTINARQDYIMAGEAPQMSGASTYQ